VARLRSEACRAAPHLFKLNGVVDESVRVDAPTTSLATAARLLDGTSAGFQLLRDGRIDAPQVVPRPRRW